MNSNFLQKNIGNQKHVKNAQQIITIKPFTKTEGAHFLYYDPFATAIPLQLNRRKQKFSYYPYRREIHCHSLAWMCVFELVCKVYGD